MIGTFAARARRDAAPRDRAARHPVLERHAGEHLARVPRARRRHSSVTNQGVSPDADGGSESPSAPRTRAWTLARHRRPAPRLRRPALAGQPRAARRATAVRRARRRRERRPVRPRPPHRAGLRAAGSDDFGEPTAGATGWTGCPTDWCNEARLNDLGVEIAVMDLVRPLTNRLQITQWRKENPDVAAAARSSGRSSSSASRAPAPRSCSTCSPRTPTCGRR